MTRDCDVRCSVEDPSPNKEHAPIAADWCVSLLALGAGQYRSLVTRRHLPRAVRLLASGLALGGMTDLRRRLPELLILRAGGRSGAAA